MNEKVLFAKLKVSTESFSKNSRKIKFCQNQYFHRFILIFALVLPKAKVKFSGMNPGDVVRDVRVTVMEEMNHLNISRDKPLDLIAKPWNLAKTNKLF